MGKSVSLFIGLALCLVHPSLAANLTQNFNFDGVLTDSSGNPITSSVPILFQIYDPGVSCLLYEETHSTVTPDSTGHFSVKIGSGTRASSSVDGGASFQTIFQNSSQVRASGTNCGSGYTPASGDARLLKVTVNGVALTPNYTLGSIPMATVAETLQGKVPTDFVSTTQTTSQTVKSPLSFTNAGSYVTALQADPSSTNNVSFYLPSDAGTSGQVLSTDGGSPATLSWITPSGGGSGLTSLNGQTGSSQSFATPGTSGVAPTWSSTSDIHTLNIPMASSTSVTAGLISKTDYDNFNNKISSVTGSTLTDSNIWIGDGSNQATAVMISGDATLSNTGTLTLNGTGVTPSSYSKVTVDASGRVTSGTNLTSGDLPSSVLLDGGNTSGGTLTIGTNDNYSLNLQSNATTALTIDTNGFVGIGTSSPSALTQMYSSAGNADLRLETGGTSNYSRVLFIQGGGTKDGAIGFPPGGGTAPLMVSTTTANPIVLQTNSTERMRVSPNGNVGIGTTAPVAKLQVAGGAFVTSYNDAVSSNSIDWSLGNIQSTTAACNYTFSGMVSGGVYKLYATSPGSTCQFTHSGMTLKYPGGGGSVSFGGSYPVLLTFTVVGTFVFVEYNTY